MLPCYFRRISVFDLGLGKNPNLESKIPLFFSSHDIIMYFRINFTGKIELNKKYYILIDSRLLFSAYISPDESELVESYFFPTKQDFWRIVILNTNILGIFDQCLRSIASNSSSKTPVT